MKYFVWLLRIGLFVVLLGFAVKNNGMVTLRFFLDAAWTLPLVVVLLIFFAAGALAGLSVALGTFLRQRREIARLKKAIDAGPGPADPAVREAAEFVAQALSVVAPYVAEEMWELLGHTPSVANSRSTTPSARSPRKRPS